MVITRRAILPFILAALAVLPSCTETATGPTVGSGDILDATVNGTPLSLDLVDATDFNTYDVALHQTHFGGTLTSGNTTKTITVSLTYDLDNGTFPHTLTGSAITINYAERTNGVDTIYDCPIGTSSCTVTLSGSNGTIVDGTFSATLAQTNDATKTVTITAGKFSAKLTRR